MTKVMIESLDGSLNDHISDAYSREYLSHVYVRLPDRDELVQVEFITPNRLAQELSANLRASDGVAFYAEPGLIVVSEIKAQILTFAAQRAYEAGFFDRIK